MICFPNAKINIGLYITSKRPDGFHNLESIFYPIPLNDVMEIKESRSFSIESFGLIRSDDYKSNIVYKTWLELKSCYDLPAFKINLLKNIPPAAGLGGGSSDASFFLKTINKSYNLGLSTEKMKEFILKIGSDCPFFIENKPSLVRGRGEILQESEINISCKFITIVKPSFSISTSTAFSKLNLQYKPVNLEQEIKQPIDKWKDLISNDFENLPIKEMQEVALLKRNLYDMGADFVLMSGSGSAVFALSNSKLKLNQLKNKYLVRQLMLK